MSFYLKGVHVPHRKNTSDSLPVRMPPPEIVKIPSVMHIGAPAVPVVKKGDEVKVGTLIAEQSGVVSSHVYSSVSGTVEAIESMLLSNGRTSPAVVIRSDGAMTPDPAIAPPVVTSREELIAAIRQSGMVGLGGAGFPTHVKFDTDKKIEELIINVAECEPYITSDSVTLTGDTDDVVCALDALLKFIEIPKVIFGIEKNKPQAISAARKIAEKNPKISVKVLPEVYPQGGEKVLIYHVTGKRVAMGKLPIDTGCIVINVTTLASIGKTLKTGMPLVEKCVTVDGNAVKEPKNVLVPIGTSLRDLFAFCGGFTAEPEKVLYGGPMMGISVPDLEQPVIKNTNAVIAFAGKQAHLPEPSACIRCGACINSCPFGLNPPAIAKAYKNSDWDALTALSIGTCMECGCCSFICPAHRPIVQNNRLAKRALAEHKAKEAK